MNDAVVRYNVSQNEKWAILCMADLMFPEGSEKLQFYNNTFYIPMNRTVNFIRSYFDPNATITGQAYFKNNIIYNLGTAIYPPMPSAVFDYNVMYGNHHSTEPADTHKQVSDPQLVAPGSGGIGRTTVDGYKLRSTSPAIGTGMLIADNGGLDYWGNAVSSTTAPNRGAYNGAGISVAMDTITLGTYKLTNANSGKALGILGNSTANDATANQYSYLGNNSQKWVAEDAGSGYYKFKNVNSGKYLGIVGNGTANDAKANQYDYLGNVSQQWQVYNLGGGTYRLVNRYSGRALGVTGNSTANDADINQYDWLGNNSQKWTFGSP